MKLQVSLPQSTELLPLRIRKNVSVIIKFKKMINYELALKLKKAGFPQELENGDWGYCVDCGETSDLHLTHDDNDEGGFVGNDYIHRIGDEHRLDGHNVMIKVPTLSELMSAMPMREKHLGTINDAHFQIWKLVSRNEEGKYRACMVDEMNGHIIEGYSFTSVGGAEEAVANLWLALNEK